MIKKAILKNWNSSNHTAAVEICGSARAYLEGVKAARNMSSGEMIAGRNVAVLFMDKSNPTDAVIIAVYA